jgi:hypothetical protein
LKVNYYLYILVQEQLIFSFYQIPYLLKSGKLFICLSDQLYRIAIQLQGIFTREELQRYSKKFLCGLHIMSHGNLNNSVKAFDVFFKNVSPEAYERPSFGYQATNEIVQNLVQNELIERDGIEFVKLTQKGLDKCKEDCY